jgi:hypothetical protein
MGCKSYKTHTYTLHLVTICPTSPFPNVLVGCTVMELGFRRFFVLRMRLYIWPTFDWDTLNLLACADIRLLLTINPANSDLPSVPYHWCVRMCRICLMRRASIMPSDRHSYGSTRKRCRRCRQIVLAVYPWRRAATALALLRPSRGEWKPPPGPPCVRSDPSEELKVFWFSKYDCPLIAIT